MTDVIERFFESYGALFTRFDANEIADLFAYPLHITSAADEVQLTALADRNAWIPQLDRLLAVYRKIGVRSAEVVSLTTKELSRYLVLADVRWTLRDASGSEIYRFRGVYTLVGADHHLRIAAIAHDEMPQIRRRLAEQR